MSIAKAQTHVTDSGIVCNGRLNPRTGKIYIPTFVVTSPDKTQDIWEFNDDARLVTHRRFSLDTEPPTLLKERKWPEGTTLHAIGEHELNKLFQNRLAHLRKTHEEAKQ